MSRWLLPAFRLVYLLSILSSCLFGLLVLASLLLADVSRAGGQVILVSALVSTIAFGLAVLLAGIRHYASTLMKATCGKPNSGQAGMLFRLVACLLAAGAFVLAVMLLFNLGALVRIGEGAAVFG